MVFMRLQPEGRVRSQSLASPGVKCVVRTDRSPDTQFRPGPVFVYS